MSADEHTEAGQVGSGGSIAGSLPDLPDLTWEDFERASALASFDVTRDINGTPTEVDAGRRERSGEPEA
jgi:hypothetical protein